MTDAIMDAYRKSLTELGELEEEAQDAIKAINRQAFREARPLTTEEKAELKKLRASQVEIRDGINRLSFETLQQLDSSPEIAALVTRIVDLKAMVQGEAAKLGAIGKIAEQASKTTEALAKLAESAQALKDTLDEDTA